MPRQSRRSLPRWRLRTRHHERCRDKHVAHPQTEAVGHTSFYVNHSIGVMNLSGSSHDTRPCGANTNLLCLDIFLCLGALWNASIIRSRYLFGRILQWDGLGVVHYHSINFAKYFFSDSSLCGCFRRILSDVTLNEQTQSSISQTSTIRLWPSSDAGVGI